jgi:hypothetical protein
MPACHDVMPECERTVGLQRPLKAGELFADMHHREGLKLMSIAAAGRGRTRVAARRRNILRIVGALASSTLMLAGCATSGRGALSGSGSASASSGRPGASWAPQDGSVAKAGGLPCGPAPSGENEALAMMLSAERATSSAQAPVPPSPSDSSIGPRSAGKSFDSGKVKLYPPLSKPLVCMDDALKVADAAPVEPSAVEQIWLGQLDASFPASDVGGVNKPWFTNVLAWVVVTDATRDKEGCGCGTPSPGSTETAFIDADTGQRLFATGYDIVLGPAN